MLFFSRDNITAKPRLIKSTAKFRSVYILNDAFYYIIDLMKTSIFLNVNMMNELMKNNTTARAAAHAQP